MAHFDLQIVLPEMKQLANDVALAPFVADALDKYQSVRNWQQIKQVLGYFAGAARQRVHAETQVPA